MHNKPSVGKEIHIHVNKYTQRKIIINTWKGSNLYKTIYRLRVTIIGAQQTISRKANTHICEQIYVTITKNNNKRVEKEQSLQNNIQITGYNYRCTANNQ